MLPKSPSIPVSSPFKKTLETYEAKKTRAIFKERKLFFTSLNNKEPFLRAIRSCRGQELESSSTCFANDFGSMGFDK